MIQFECKKFRLLPSNRLLNIDWNTYIIPFRDVRVIKKTHNFIKKIYLLSTYEYQPTSIKASTHEFKMETS